MMTSSAPSTPFFFGFFFLKSWSIKNYIASVITGASQTSLVPHPRFLAGSTIGRYLTGPSLPSVYPGPPLSTSSTSA
ncbi:hypothetical protein K450DRAFT_258752 [Umbelopsis ramanniana AG]|uniref:Uncharacterized protein n=1 Tax=Umbelopsis ramanniana AG TaxID=1314678 RepID=A0AAD5E3D1_UMBRA|nr:uncharacterized protein K450DRAFT_258752 [Umbelopsis ramanniana AG]KAI8576067.1 hypothetical protein K450DRAFT_258752 [Umbelopsis ramanniana AG]